jgi:hypothetical protein
VQWRRAGGHALVGSFTKLILGERSLEWNWGDSGPGGGGGGPSAGGGQRRQGLAAFGGAAGCRGPSYVALALEGGPPLGALPAARPRRAIDASTSGGELGKGGDAAGEAQGWRCGGG